jgi:integrase
MKIYKIYCEWCEKLERKQHRCPYLKIGMKKSQIDNFKSQIILYEEEIKLLREKVAIYQEQNSKFVKCVQEAQEKLKPVSENKIPRSYKDVIEKSYQNNVTRDAKIKLFDEYVDWCFKKNYERSLNPVSITESRDYKNIYDPDNALEFVNEEKKYQRTTRPHRLNFFLKVMKKCTGNNWLDYSAFIPKGAVPKLKHLTNDNEMSNFFKWAAKEGKGLTSFIVELIYKFAVRIGAISKLKVSSLHDNNILVFQEKFNKYIRRKLLPGTAERLRFIIKSQNLSSENYIFFPNKFKEDIRKRDRWFSTKIIQAFASSNCFEKLGDESVCSHMLRGSRAVLTAESEGLHMAQLQLNHSNPRTTLNSYILPEARGLMENIESKIKMPNIIDNFSRKKRKRQDNFIEKEEINNRNSLNNINNKRKN